MKKVKLLSALLLLVLSTNISNSQQTKKSSTSRFAHNWNKEVRTMSDSVMEKRQAYYNKLLLFDTWPQEKEFSINFKKREPLSIQIAKHPAISELRKENQQGKRWGRKSHKFTFYICALLTANGWNIDNAKRFENLSIKYDKDDEKLAEEFSLYDDVELSFKNGVFTLENKKTGKITLLTLPVGSYSLDSYTIETDEGPVKIFVNTQEGVSKGEVSIMINPEGEYERISYNETKKIIETEKYKFFKENNKFIGFAKRTYKVSTVDENEVGSVDFLVNKSGVIEANIKDLISSEVKLVDGYYKMKMEDSDDYVYINLDNKKAWKYDHNAKLPKYSQDIYTTNEQKRLNSFHENLKNQISIRQKNGTDTDKYYTDYFKIIEDIRANKRHNEIIKFGDDEILFALGDDSFIKENREEDFEEYDKIILDDNSSFIVLKNKSNGADYIEIEPGLYSKISEKTIIGNTMIVKENGTYVAYEMKNIKLTMSDDFLHGKKKTIDKLYLLKNGKLYDSQFNELEAFEITEIDTKWTVTEENGNTFFLDLEKEIGKVYSPNMAISMKDFEDVYGKENGAKITDNIDLYHKKIAEKKEMAEQAEMKLRYINFLEQIEKNIATKNDFVFIAPTEYKEMIGIGNEDLRRACDEFNQINKLIRLIKEEIDEYEELELNTKLSKKEKRKKLDRKERTINRLLDDAVALCRSISKHNGFNYASNSQDVISDSFEDLIQILREKMDRHKDKVAIIKRKRTKEVGDTNIDVVKIEGKPIHVNILRSLSDLGLLLINTKEEITELETESNS